MSTTDSTHSGLDDEQLESVYSWVDEVPLSRPKKDIVRDFSDCVLAAEIVKFYFPGMVDMHNYPAASSVKKKEVNWILFNKKVLRKHFDFSLSDYQIASICKCSKNCVIEKVLLEMKTRIEKILNEQHKQPPPPLSSYREKLNESDQPEADQYTGSKQKGGKGHSKGHTHHAHKIQVPMSMPRQMPPMVLQQTDKKELAMKYEEKEHESRVKDETIAILQSKTQRLEHLLQLKDMRLNELQSQVEALRQTGYRR